MKYTKKIAQTELIMQLFSIVRNFLSRDLRGIAGENRK